jgi:hypothetical protein
VAEQVVWVKGQGAGVPQSIVFPGSLTLGDWRLRGTEAGALWVERFDSDGTLVTDSWLQVASIVHNADTNTSKFEAQSLSAGQTFTNTLRAKDTADVTIDDSVVIAGNVTALNGEFGVVTGTTEVSTDTIRGRVAEQVTVDDNLRVTGVTELQGNVAVSGQVAAQSMFCTGDMTILGNLYAPSPFWVCGSFDGTNLVKYSDRGRHSFTVLRPSGLATGVFTIVFAEPHPNLDNYTVNVAAENGIAYVRGRAFGPVTSFGFDIITRDVSNFSQSTNNVRVHLTVHA